MKVVITLAVMALLGSVTARAAEPILISIQPTPNGCHYYCPTKPQ